MTSGLTATLPMQETCLRSVSGGRVRARSHTTNRTEIFMNRFVLSSFLLLSSFSSRAVIVEPQPLPEPEVLPLLGVAAAVALAFSLYKRQ